MFFNSAYEWANYDARPSKKTVLLDGVTENEQTLYAFHIFKRQTSIFSCKWYPETRCEEVEKQSKNYRLCAREERELLLGLLFSVKSFSQKLSPESSKVSMTPFTPQEFLSFSTAFYKLHYFESLTGYKFVLITKPGIPDLVNLLQSVYSDVYVTRVLRCFEPTASLELQTKLFSEELQSFLFNQYPSLLNTLSGKLTMHIIELECS